MKPTLSQKIANSQIHWFRKSNSYLILDYETDQLFDLFLHSDDFLDFKKLVHKTFNYEIKNISRIYNQLAFAYKQLNENNHPDRSLLQISEASQIEEIFFSTSYDLGHCSIKLNYGSEKIKKVFHPAFSHLTTSRRKPNTQCPELTITEKSKILHFFKNQTLIYTSPIAEFNHIQGQLNLELINCLYAKKKEDWLATFHGSTLSYGKKAIMLVGNSGSGKSSLTAILASQGYNFVADDFSPMSKEDLKVYGFPNAISIKEGSFGSLKNFIPNIDSLPSVTSYSKNIESKNFVPKSTSLNQSYNCNIIVLVKYNSNDINRLEPSNPETVLPELISDSWINPEYHCAYSFLNWLSSVEYYKLNYNDNQFALEQMERLFKN